MRLIHAALIIEKVFVRCRFIIAVQRSICIKILHSAVSKKLFNNNRVAMRFIDFDAFRMKMFQFSHTVFIIILASIYYYLILGNRNTVPAGLIIIIMTVNIIIIIMTSHRQLPRASAC